MARRVKLAVNWAAACGGCDVAILDLEQAVLQVAELAEFVYWPVAMDFKRDDLRALPDGGVEVGLFNGAVRTAEQEEDALLMRAKCKLLVAFGACACFGGIPGLANASSREELLQTVYEDTPSTDNPEHVAPVTDFDAGAARVQLPALSETVRALHQVVPVDLFAPGCPPPTHKIEQLVQAVADVAAGEAPPPRGTFLASGTALCRECPRGGTRGTRRPESFTRPHLALPDPEHCLLDQGIICMGIATRGGCGASCIEVNMPCRGCFGPAPHQLDPGAELVTALAALPGPRGQWEMPVHQIVSPVRAVADPLGTFYRFSYPVSLGRRTVRDAKQGG